MTTIYNWKAKRSGAAITIEGTTGTGVTIKIKAESITTDDELRPLVAIAADGTSHQLFATRLPEELLAKCAGAGLEAAVVMSQFIKDLCALEGSAGSDERMYAQQWFDRSGFGGAAYETRYLAETRHFVD